MMIQVLTAALNGVQGMVISVEVDISSGLPCFHIVGLGDTTVQEARERVRVAIKNSFFEFPLQRITVNLAPAHVPKDGPAFDFPIAMGILGASGQCSCEALENTLFLGELSLNGSLRPVSAILPLILAAKSNNIKRVFIPFDNLKEASIVEGIQLFPFSSLSETINKIIIGDIEDTRDASLAYATASSKQFPFLCPDISDVCGQETAKRALEIAAAGGHNTLLIGPPGSGKTMLARRLPGILPPLTEKEATEVACIQSAARHDLNNTLPLYPPFRSPHHTISTVGLVGGGSPPSPGEITLAHNGVLFLDELPEFNRDRLESLRQPMEEGHINITRSRYKITFPASFVFMGAMNPCPCGYFGDLTGKCRCTPPQIQKYLAKLSGPILDRIDLHLEVPRLSHDELSSGGFLNNTIDTTRESSVNIRKRVIKAREFQKERFGQSLKDTTETIMNYCNDISYCNSKIPDGILLHNIKLSSKVKKFLDRAMSKLHLSARSHNRVLIVARTIADLEESKEIKEEHVAEALHYRKLLSNINAL